MCIALFNKIGEFLIHPFHTTTDSNPPNDHANACKYGNCDKDPLSHK